MLARPVVAGFSLAGNERAARPVAVVVRASLAALALVAGAASCASAVAAGHPSPVRTPAGTAAAVVTPAPRSSSPAAARARVAAAPVGYRVAADESYPAVKRAAVRAALALTNYGPSASRADVAAAVTADPARRSALAAGIPDLYHRGSTSVGRVVYPQMGGFAGDRASVMVVVRQTVTRHGRSAVTQTRTLDVRLVRHNGAWRFDALASDGGAPVARPGALSADAAAVVDNPRILLPDTARWDIYRGAISPVLLRLMAQIAERTPYAVTVLETGHPFDVFGTSHMSMHSAGRAVDINLLAGSHVVDQHRAGSPAYHLVTWLLAQPQVGQVGAPWDLDGASARSFTNGVHLDHVHISV